MIKILLIVIGIVLLIWFLLPVFSHGILNIGNMTGLGVSLVLLLYGIFFHPVNHGIAVLWRHTAGRIIEIILGLCILGILVLAAMTMICMGRGMTATAGNANGGQDAEQARTVIVLGCKTIGDQPSLMLEERLQAAYKYLAAHPESNAIVSGGQGKDETTSEAEVMYDWLLERGISENRILMEDRSTDTHENLQFCREIIMQMQAGEGSTMNETPVGGEGVVKNGASGWSTYVMLATNEFHEYRALKIARAMGYDAEPLPAASAWWLFPTYYVREMYGILEDWFLK